MADTGWKFPGTTANVTPTFGGTAWTNPGNVTASDNSYATVAPANGSNSRFLRASNFSFNVPTGATIDSIEVEVEAKVSATGGVDITGFLALSGAEADDNAIFTSSPTTSDAAYSINSSDWSGVWSLSGAPSISDVNASGFSAMVLAYNSSGGSRTISLDGIRARVFYTLTPIAGTASITWSNFTCGATGAVALAAAASPTWGAFSLSAAGAVALIGAAAITWPAFTVTSASTLALAASASPTWGAFSLSSTAVLGLAAAASPTWGPFTLTSTGLLPLVGTVDVTWAPFLTQSVIEHDTDIHGQGNGYVGDFGLAATGALLGQGQADISWGAFSLAATGALNVAGAAAPTWGNFSLEATANITLEADANITWGNFSLSSAAGITLSAAASPTWPPFSLSSASHLKLDGDAAITWGEWDLTTRARFVVHTQVSPDRILVLGSDLIEDRTLVLGSDLIEDRTLV